jgi:hypothetical protein
VTPGCPFAAAFSGHVYNYERFTRTVNGKQIAYLVAGCGGGQSPLEDAGHRAHAYVIDSTLTLGSLDDMVFGYLRLVVNSTTKTIEFHPESDGGVTKTPDDTVTINLADYTKG